MEYEECDCILTESEKVQSCYSVVRGGVEHHEVTFTDGLDVVHNQLLNKWRDDGFEVFAFGQNRCDVDNCTAVFIRSVQE